MKVSAGKVFLAVLVFWVCTLVGGTLFYLLSWFNNSASLFSEILNALAWYIAPAAAIVIASALYYQITENTAHAPLIVSSVLALALSVAILVMYISAKEWKRVVQYALCVAAAAYDIGIAIHTAKMQGVAGNE